MIIDITGIELIPGNNGIDCTGNGSIQCCCYECEYMMCCLETHKQEEYKICQDPNCPRAGK